MKVKIISVSSDTTLQKKDGGTYIGTQIVYHNIDKNAIENKNIHKGVLDKNPQLKGKVVSLTKDQVVDFVFEKQGMFNNLIDITAAEETQVVAKKETAAFKGGFRAEDPAKQRSIIRQNALAHATALFVKTVDKDTKLDATLAHDIIEMARIFEAYSAGDNN